jgi:hypothetical protein
MKLKLKCAKYPPQHLWMFPEKIKNNGICSILQINLLVSSSYDLISESDVLLESNQRISFVFHSF